MPPYVLVLPAGVTVLCAPARAFERCGMLKAAMPPDDCATHFAPQYAAVAAVAAKPLKPLRRLPWFPDFAATPEARFREISIAARF